MDPLVISLVLAAAVSHAVWNAVVKSSGDRLITMAIIMGTGGVLAIPAVFILPLPHADAWPYIAASVAIHMVYNLFLVRAYAIGDLSLIYPVARGSAPLFVAVFAALLANEYQNDGEIIAILVICGGIFSLTLVGHKHAVGKKPLVYALIIGLMISLYTVADGVGARVSENAASYIAWLFLLECQPIIFVALWRRRGRIRQNTARVWRAGIAGGLIANMAYGTVIWAMSVAPMAHVSALRETSVIIAALIGTRLLGEAGGKWRVGAATVVALGVVGLHMASGSPA
jgi:drug/metabolite transporter (DMT)-like permease